jgi:hypothetical protein
MKTRPARNHLAGKRELRDRITAGIFKSESGRRVLKECLEALERPANSDEYSRRLVIARYASELSILEYELEELLVRYSRSQAGAPFGIWYFKGCGL